MNSTQGKAIYHLPSGLACTPTNAGVPDVSALPLPPSCCVPRALGFPSAIWVYVGKQEGQQESRGGTHPKDFCPTIPHLGCLCPSREFSSPEMD